jgi:hypothetical protein
VTLDGAPIVTPYTFTGVVGFKRELGTPSPQTVGGTTYQFDHWSDGAAQVHTFVTPNNDTTVTATFTATSSGDPPPGTVVASDAFARTVSNGWGSATTGGAYTPDGTAANYSVGGGTGNIVLPVAGNSRGASLTSVSVRDVDIRRA